MYCNILDVYEALKITVYSDIRLYKLSLLLFYYHYTGQHALASTFNKNLRILLEKSFTSHVPLLMATNTFRLDIGVEFSSTALSASFL